MGRLTDLGDESAKTPWIHPQEDSRNVTCYFVRTTQDHTPHKPRCLPSPTKIGMREGGDGEEGCIGNVGGERRTVAIYARFNWAKLDLD